MLLVRDRMTDNAIMGRLYLTDSLVLYTLENRSKALPEDVYTLTVCHSPHFGRDIPLITNENIPPTRGFRIHEGNDWTASSGCVLVGMSSRDDKLVDSRKAADIVTDAAVSDRSLVIASVYHEKN
jgi:hypothetical protein